MGARINTIMQTCFFAISGVLPRDEAIAQIKNAIKKTYGKRGDEVVQQNFAAVDETLAHLHEVKVPSTVTSHARDAAGRLRQGARLRQARHRDDDGQPRATCCPSARSRWTAPGRPARRSGRSGTSPRRFRSGTRRSASSATSARWSARTPRSARRSYDPALLAGAPATFKSTDFKGNEFTGRKYTLQVAPEDCTGCGLCVMVCPAKDKTNPKHKAIDMAPQPPLREAEAANFEFFLDLPDVGPHARSSSTSRARSSCSRCSSSPAPAPAAARRRTSSC